MENSNLEIIKKFEESWKETEHIFSLFEKGGIKELKTLREFLLDQKLKGENQHFRVGFSFYTLIFSRSIENGLRDNQKQISIDKIDLNKYQVKFREGSKIYQEFIISDLKDSRLLKLLETLKKSKVS